MAGAAGRPTTSSQPSPGRTRAWQSAMAGAVGRQATISSPPRTGRTVRPMYHNGVYHLFYQYNPLGATWGKGNLSWGHSVSQDLVNWAALETAIDPTAPFDANGCWSGSATILPGGVPAMLYTGGDADRVQVQNIAFAKNPADPLLREWVKPAYNPVIPHPADVLFNQFRDPSTAWVGSDGMWRILVAAQVGSNNTGIASTLVYRSKDFRHWERNASPLYTSRAAGMVECPDLFPVAEPGMDEGRLDYAAGTASGAMRHVLKLSVMNTTEDYYAVGQYDNVADTFTPEVDGERIIEDCRTWRRFDYGHVYASKSFFDARKNRRVLWAWVNESDSEDDDIARGWSGLQIVPRKVWLDGDGKQLRQWPVDEIETLRTKRVGHQLVGLHVNTGGVKEITGAGAQAAVEVVFQIPDLEGAETFEPKWLLDPQKLCEERGVSVPGGVGPFGLLVMASGDLREHTSVFFRVFRRSDNYRILMCTDLTRSTRRDKVYKLAYGGFVDMDMEEQGSTISLRTLVDYSVVESFGGGGRTCMTARVYPEHAEKSNSHVFVFNNGTGGVKVTRLDAWRLKTATVNVVPLRG
ncbi:hypothetical protein VPH35_024708 [Triticum aestivum]